MGLYLNYNRTTSIDHDDDDLNWKNEQEILDIDKKDEDDAIAFFHVFLGNGDNDGI